MEKTGFIYIWYDRKHKRYYIGSHWGTESDGYICSSNWMRDAYRRRPTDFRRKIIQTDIIREELCNVEHRWLSLIKDEELGKRYYNLKNKRTGNWAHDEDNRLTTGQKISKARKGKKRRPHSDETKCKIGLANKGKTSHNKGKSMSEEQKIKIGKSNAVRLIGRTLTEEHRQNISNSIKSHWKENRSKSNKVIL